MQSIKKKKKTLVDLVRLLKLRCELNTGLKFNPRT